ncbi:hypothetical protein DSAG12_04240 [Promethearchaeum syntrophicum]|uniref:Uncharacterized protein n=1 Tax=Promethearchaeum syntrophicum TaxID=2594042 RepID=A0AC61ZTZ4_9ARCH|nr:hypothetical protein [Candidatus Prometheoarchaeum syntrophicum]
MFDSENPPITLRIGKGFFYIGRIEHFQVRICPLIDFFIQGNYNICMVHGCGADYFYVICPMAVGISNHKSIFVVEGIEFIHRVAHFGERFSMGFFWCF